jgi:uncharacterized protein (DUF1800 family)
MIRTPKQIAETRFGYGIKFPEAADPKGWLTRQFAHGSQAIPGVESSIERMRAFQDYQQAKQQAKQSNEMSGFDRRLPDRTFRVDLSARQLAMASSETPLVERLVAFWNNLLCVSTLGNQPILMLAVPYENEVIRPHLTGSYAEMLYASATHPAMLIYLDQARSVGPNSRMGKRRKRDINENYARELLELHTLGTGHYDQTDVRQLAYLLTGWTIHRKHSEVRFSRAQAEPGKFTVVRHSFRSGRPEALREVCDRLAAHPATAHRISRKLAAHFVADEPPDELVNTMAEAWLGSVGNLRIVTQTLLEHKAAWRPQAHKFRPPAEWLTGVLAVAGVSVAHNVAKFIPKSLQQLGHTPFAPPSPEGWPDGASNWLTPDGLVTRTDIAQVAGRRFAKAKLKRQDVAERFSYLEEATLEAMRTASNHAEGIALVLLSPEFNRR